MRATRWDFLFVMGLLLGLVIACNYSASTAHIGGLKLGKDKAASPETSGFSSGDTVYAVADIANAPGKVKVKGRLAVEDVEGQKSGPVPGLETTLDLAGSGTATFNFSPPPNGWPKGKYKIEIFMLNEEGEQKDQVSQLYGFLARLEQKQANSGSVVWRCSTAPSGSLTAGKAKPSAPLPALINLSTFQVETLITATW